MDQAAHGQQGCSDATSNPCTKQMCRPDMYDPSRVEAADTAGICRLARASSCKDTDSIGPAGQFEGCLDRSLGGDAARGLGRDVEGALGGDAGGTGGLGHPTSHAGVKAANAVVG